MKNSEYKNNKYKNNRYKNSKYNKFSENNIENDISGNNIDNCINVNNNNYNNNYNNNNNYNSNDNYINKNIGTNINRNTYKLLTSLFLILTLFSAFAVVMETNQVLNLNPFNGFESSDSIFNSVNVATDKNESNLNNKIDLKHDSNSDGINKAHAASKTYSSSSAKSSTTGSSKSVSQSGVISASKNLKKYVKTNKRLPKYVTVEGSKYSVPEFTYLMTKTIENKKKKVYSKVNVKYNIKNPSKPAGTTIRSKIYLSKYYSYALKTTKYINKYKKIPNFITASSRKKIQYQTAVYMFASVLNYNYYYKKLPKYVSVSVSKSHKLNKYVPKYVRASKSKNVPNSNSIWIQSKDFNRIDLNKLSKSGIGNVFLHEAAISKYGKSAVVKWAKNAASKGIKTHLWVQCFYSNGKWINPINTAKKSYNQAQFNRILSKIKTYSRMDYISGIHLDYLRYPGTAYKYNYKNGVTGEKAITNFLSQVRSCINKYDPDIILSAAVMPETSANARYYGQNIPKMGKYLDVIVPMVYKGNYNKASSWITATTKWFVSNSGGAKIWTGLQSYKSDNKPVALSASALKKDCLASLLGGAKGLALFRWGLTSFFNFLSLY